MIKPFTARLLLDCIGLCLFMVCFAYYWQGNTFHEWVGACFITFVLIHNILNQTWYSSKAKRLPHKQFGYTRLVAQIGFILIAMVLLISSILLSRSINPCGPISFEYWIRQVHHLSAYWLLVLIGVHLGRNWPKIIAIIQAKQPQFVKMVRISSFRKSIILSSLLFAGYGFSQLGIMNKLLMTPSLSMWDFANQAPEFLLFIGGVVFGFVTLTYQLTKKIH